MNSVLTTILGFYTLILIGGLFYYEEKIARLNRELDILDSDYDEVFQAYVRTSNQSEHSAIHHQMEINEILDVDNQALKAQIKALKAENVELRATAGDWQRAYQINKPIQYNYSYWQPDNNVTSWTPSIPVGTKVISLSVEDSYEEFVQDVLDLEQ